MPPPSAGNAVVPSLDDGEDDFEADISTQTVPTGLQPGAFQRYYNDQSQLDASKKSGVIVILMADLLNHEMMDAHKRAVAAASTPSDMLDPNTTAPTTAPTAPKPITHEDLATTNKVLSGLQLTKCSAQS
jgi:hypothetical protein